MKNRIDNILRNIYLLPTKTLEEEYNFLNTNQDNKYVCNRIKKEIDARNKYGLYTEPREINNFGLVYLLKCNKYYKIGITSNINDRLSTIRMSNPYKVELIYCEYFDDYIKVEKELHTKYLKKRIRGEWFELTKDDVEAIDRRFRTGFSSRKCRSVALYKIFTT